MKKILSFVTFIALCTAFSPVYAMGGNMHGNFYVGSRVSFQKPMPPKPQKHNRHVYVPPRNCHHSNTGAIVGGILGGAAVGVIIGSLVN